MNKTKVGEPFGPGRQFQEQCLVSGVQFARVRPDRRGDFIGPAL